LGLGGEGIAELAGGLVGAGVPRGEAGALAREASTDGGADPSRAAGDEGHAPLQLVADARGDAVFTVALERAHGLPSIGSCIASLHQPDPATSDHGRPPRPRPTARP